jgi:hypothetical protein
MDSMGVIGRNGSGLEGVNLNSIRRALPDRVVEEHCRQAGMKFRKRLIPPVVTVLHMIMAAFWPESSFAAAWAVEWCLAKSLGGRGLGKSPSLGSVAKARARMALEAMEGIFSWLCRRAEAVSKPIDSWMGHRVVIADGTTMAMADRAELFEAFGRGKGKHGASRYPLMRVVVVGLANTMTLMGCRLGRYREGEWSLLRPLLDLLKAGDLLVADRAFAGAHHYAAYLGKGMGFLTRVHQALKVGRLKVLWKAGERGFVTRLKINEKYRRDEPGLPRWVVVRMIAVKLKIRGKWKATWLVTSLLDHLAHPDEEVLELYARRWRVETLLREVKVGMGADVLRSLTAEGVRKEVLARLSAATIVRTIMVEAAIAKGEDPLRLSFSFAVRALLWYTPAFATQPVWMLPETYVQMLEEMASHKVPWRPGRQEPRAVRMEKKRYPALHTTRAQWRLENAA